MQGGLREEARRARGLAGARSREGQLVCGPSQEVLPGQPADHHHDLLDHGHHRHLPALLQGEHGPQLPQRPAPAVRPPLGERGSPRQGAGAWPALELRKGQDSLACGALGVEGEGGVSQEIPLSLESAPRGSPGPPGPGCWDVCVTPFLISSEDPGDSKGREGDKVGSEAVPPHPPAWAAALPEKRVLNGLEPRGVADDTPASPPLWGHAAGRAYPSLGPLSPPG